MMLQHGISMAVGQTGRCASMLAMAPRTRTAVAVSHMLMGWMQSVAG